MAAGVKTTLTVQELPALTVVLQVLVCAKLAVFAPVTAMAMPVRPAFPEFVRVTVCAVDDVPTACEGKVSDAGEMVTTGRGGAVMVKDRAALVPPPGAGFATITWAVPTLVIAEDGTDAVSWVGLT